MDNEVRIDGDRNKVFQSIEKSKIELKQGEDPKTPTKPKTGLIGIVIALLALIATVIIGWDDIIKFFTS